MNIGELIIMSLALILSVGIVLYVIVKTVKTFRIRKYGAYLEATIVKAEKVSSKAGVICNLHYEFEYDGKKIVKIERIETPKDGDLSEDEFIGQNIYIYYHPKYNVMIGEGKYKQVLMSSILFGVFLEIFVIVFALILLIASKSFNTVYILMGILTIIYTFFKLYKLIAIKKYGKYLEATVVNVEKEVKSYYVNCEIEFNGKTIQRRHKGLRKRDIDCKNISIGDKCNVYYNPKYNCVLIEQLYKIEFQGIIWLTFAGIFLVILFIITLFNDGII